MDGWYELAHGLWFRLVKALCFTSIIFIWGALGLWIGVEEGEPVGADKFFNFILQLHTQPFSFRHLYFTNRVFIPFFCFLILLLILLLFSVGWELAVLFFFF
ncbi:hypothetical protein BZA05DRAFT_99442 [Tricharina praecox]|uniref:uncharacterized protein n=1 Tax=Tricharina praecox TaxID=43433 RepID=UPI00221FC079|nr:uncharacterized protein BZA05DRAFT_99442 [Tricharina praecox]KAI5857559.1 hypothetical protein BZA05DRAFT_99442 [Tricharina praecox]